MKFAKRVMGFCLLSCLMISGHAMNQTPATLELESVAKLSSETRLRKLHLVRPDLIGYPIVYDVYC